MPNRTIAIGDIHGCRFALDTLLNAIQPDVTDTLITLGDYIDRGPDSRGVIDTLLRLVNDCQLIPLFGNHEEMLLAAMKGKSALRKWLTCGGVETLQSYGWRKGTYKSALADWIPIEHQRFLTACRSYHETETHIFVHAGLEPDLPLEDQPEAVMRWRVTDAMTATRHYSGKTVIVGHTPQKSGEILDLGFLINLDTDCVRGGYLTALDIETGMIWQADNSGTHHYKRGII